MEPGLRRLTQWPHYFSLDTLGKLTNGDKAVCRTARVLSDEKKFRKGFYRLHSALAHSEADGSELKSYSGDMNITLDLERQDNCKRKNLSDCARGDPPDVMTAGDAADAVNNLPVAAPVQGTVAAVGASPAAEQDWELHDNPAEIAPALSANPARLGIQDSHVMLSSGPQLAAVIWGQHCTHLHPGADRMLFLLKEARWIDTAIALTLRLVTAA